MLTRTAALSTTSTMTANELAQFAMELPGDATITFREERGDLKDPREAGYRRTTITATWTETS